MADFQNKLRYELLNRKVPLSATVSSSPVPKPCPAGSFLGFSPQGPAAPSPVLPPSSAMPEPKSSGASVGFSSQPSPVVPPSSAMPEPKPTGSSVGFSPQGSRASRSVPLHPKPKPAGSSLKFSPQGSQASGLALQPTKADDSGAVGQQVDQAPMLWPFPGEGAEEFATRLLEKARAILREFRLLPKEDR